jgi:hypothetical protein
VRDGRRIRIGGASFDHLVCLLEGDWWKALAESTEQQGERPSRG